MRVKPTPSLKVTLICPVQVLGLGASIQLVLLQDWVFHFSRTEWTPGRPGDLCTRRVSEIHAHLPMCSVPCTAERIQYSEVPPRIERTRRASGHYTAYDTVVGPWSVHGPCEGIGA